MVVLQWPLLRQGLCEHGHRPGCASSPSAAYRVVLWALCLGCASSSARALLGLSPACPLLSPTNWELVFPHPLLFFFVIRAQRQYATNKYPRNVVKAALSSTSMCLSKERGKEIFDDSGCAVGFSVQLG